MTPDFHGLFAGCARSVDRVGIVGKRGLSCLAQPFEHRDSLERSGDIYPLWTREFFAGPKVLPLPLRQIQATGIYPGLKYGSNHEFSTKAILIPDLPSLRVCRPI